MPPYTVRTVSIIFPRHFPSDAIPLLTVYTQGWMEVGMDGEVSGGV